MGSGRLNAIEGAEVVDITSADHVFLNPVRRIWVGVGGSIKVTFPDGSVVTYTNVPAGPLDIAPSRIWMTGTTADEMLGER